MMDVHHYNVSKTLHLISHKFMKKKVEIIKTRANKIAVGIFLLFISTLYCPKQLFASEFIEVQQQQDQKEGYLKYERQDASKYPVGN